MWGTWCIQWTCDRSRATWVSTRTAAGPLSSVLSPSFHLMGESWATVIWTPKALKFINSANLYCNRDIGKVPLQLSFILPERSCRWIQSHLKTRKELLYLNEPHSLIFDQARDPFLFHMNNCSLTNLFLLFSISGKRSPPFLGESQTLKVRAVKMTERWSSGSSDTLYK